LLLPVAGARGDGGGNRVGRPEPRKTPAEDRSSGDTKEAQKG